MEWIHKYLDRSYHNPLWWKIAVLKFCFSLIVPGNHCHSSLFPCSVLLRFEWINVIAKHEILSLYPLFMSLYLHIMFAVILDSAVLLIAELLWRKRDTTQKLRGEEFRLVSSFVTEISSWIKRICASGWSWMKKVIWISVFLQWPVYPVLIGNLYGHFFFYSLLLLAEFAFANYALSDHPLQQHDWL